jgi:hypothetical protein
MTHWHLAIHVAVFLCDEQLVNGNMGKADILINQFKSVFTREEKQNTAKNNETHK